MFGKEAEEGGEADEEEDGWGMKGEKRMAGDERKRERKMKGEEGREDEN